MSVSISQLLFAHLVLTIFSFLAVGVDGLVRAVRERIHAPSF